MGAEVAAEVAGWIQDLALSMLAAEVAAEQRRALQQRLRHHSPHATTPCGERRRLERRLCNQLATAAPELMLPLRCALKQQLCEAAADPIPAL